MPGVLIIEAMAQAAGILGFKMLDVKPADGTLYYFVGSTSCASASRSCRATSCNCTPSSSA